MKIVMKGIMWSFFNGYIIHGQFVDHSPHGKTNFEMHAFTLDVTHQLVGNFTARQHIGHSRSLTHVIYPPLRLTKVVGHDHLCKVGWKKYSLNVQQYPDILYNYCRRKLKHTMCVCSVLFHCVYHAGMP